MSSRMHDLASSLGFSTYDQLHRWSVSNLDEFWTEASDFLGLRWRVPPSRSLTGGHLPGTTWFPDGTLNYTEAILTHAASMPDRVAVVERSQTRSESQLSWSELSDQVRRCASGLRRLGVKKGDRVAAYAPNIAVLS